MIRGQFAFSDQDILIHIIEHPGTTAKIMAAHYKCRTETVTSRVTRLVQAGKVRRNCGQGRGKLFAGDIVLINKVYTTPMELLARAWV